MDHHLKGENMRNRHGIEYYFEQVDPDIYTIVGDLTDWRLGGKVGQDKIDLKDLGFVDPYGGPFITVGYSIAGRTVIGIWLDEDKVYFKVDKEHTV
jgi:hypothetical protein